MVINGIANDGLSKSIIDPCGVGSWTVKTNSVFYVQCGKWIYSTYAGVKRVTPKFTSNFTCRKCEGNFEEAVEWEKKLCQEIETVMEFAYLGDRLSAGGGCEADVAARTRCGLVKFGECGELLSDRRFSL